MKTLWLLAFVAAGWAWTPGLAQDQGGTLAVGDTAETVRRVLGEPRGSIRSGASEMLSYDRGRVDLMDGKVSALSLVSEAEAAARRAEEERLRQEQAEAARARREALFAEGLALKEKILADLGFLASSAAEQLAFWKGFRGRYPDVDIEEQYSQALAERRVELEQDDRERRLAELEQRIDDAEARARKAEQAANDAWLESAALESYRSRYVSYCPPVFIGWPATNRPPRTTVCPSPFRPLENARHPFMWQSDYFTHGSGSRLTHDAGRQGGTEVKVEVRP